MQMVNLRGGVREHWLKNWKMRELGKEKIPYLGITAVNNWDSTVLDNSAGLLLQLRGEPGPFLHWLTIYFWSKNTSRGMDSPIHLACPECRLSVFLWQKEKQRSPQAESHRNDSKQPTAHRDMVAAPTRHREVGTELFIL